MNRLTAFSKAFAEANRGNPCIGCVLATRCATKSMACTDFNLFYQQVSVGPMRARLSARKAALARHTQRLRSLELNHAPEDELQAWRNVIEEDNVELAALQRMSAHLANVRVIERAERDIRRNPKTTSAKRASIAAHEVTMAAENIERSKYREPDRVLYAAIFRVDPRCNSDCGMECGHVHKVAGNTLGRPRKPRY